MTGVQAQGGRVVVCINGRTREVAFPGGSIIRVCRRPDEMGSHDLWGGNALVIVNLKWYGY